MENLTAHEVLVSNAKRALKNLSKDNSVDLKKVFSSMKDIKEYFEELLWDVEEAIETEYSDEYIDYEDPKYGFDDEGF